MKRKGRVNKKEKIRGCYRKSDMRIVWADQVEKEYYNYIHL